ncbi:DUF3299 domain-containing protein [Ideonella sp. DXS22W]|uniref:DUF3299 domain-containing protein n=1 Tax=Pseudaquabacterium inlustre TaxID=2984192 RepID=A0ABU9CLA2_9BURK
MTAHRSLLTRRSGLAALATLPLWPGLAAAQPLTKPGPGGYTELRWDDLVPKGWDPMKQLKDRGIANPAQLQDTDPKAQDLMRLLREAWDNAPTEAQLDGIKVKLPGYVVPLEDEKAGLTEFLLVPYFGACVHTPPPPANQIVLVVPAKPAAGFRSMDTVWVSGVLKAKRGDSPMGTSGYRLEAAQVERYKAPAR